MRKIISVLILTVIPGVGFSEIQDTYPLPTEPFVGSRIFFRKGCVECHRVWGMGGTFGPDLTAVGREKNFFELAGDLWSHSPKMMEVMRERGLPRPTLTPEETRDLLAYLYYLGFFDEPGDYLQGEELFKKKGCADCHTLDTEGEKGVPLDRYGQYVSPVFIAAALWNHAPTVRRGMLEQSFAPREMSHLLSFIRGRASNEEGKVVHIKPGNPENGKTVFEAKKCTVCHSQGSRGLGQAPLQRSLTEIVGLMWSHSFQMVSDMRRVGLKIPRFSEQEMADLVSYLYFLPYYGEKGDPSKGKDVFSEKGCAVCHSRDAVEEGKGIDLAETAGFSLFELVSAMWNHVPEMEKMVTELNLAWPRFEKDEMKDLIAYIQSLE